VEYTRIYRSIFFLDKIGQYYAVTLLKPLFRVLPLEQQTLVHRRIKLYNAKNPYIPMNICMYIYIQDTSSWRRTKLKAKGSFYLICKAFKQWLFSKIRYGSGTKQTGLLIN